MDVKNFSPANIPNLITVAASDHNDQKADFSNWGNKIDLAAPGGDSVVEGDQHRTNVSILSLRAGVTDWYGGGICVVDDKYYRARGTSWQRRMSLVR